MAKLRLLVAEDHESLRRTLVRFLRGKEFDILGDAADGAGLVDSAISMHPDVIVSDVSMPRMTGPEAMHELNARGFHIPFIFISAGENAIGENPSFISKLNLLHELVPAIKAAVSR